MDIDFDQFTFNIDRWHGEIDTSEELSNIIKIKVDILGDSSGIRNNQKQSIISFVTNYGYFWKSISQRIKQLESSSEYELDSIISLAAPGVISSNGDLEKFDYIVGYKTYSANRYLKSFMVCINNKKVSEVIIAH